MHGKIVDPTTNEKLPFKLPAGWHEVSFFQLMQLQQEKSPSALKELSILTGVEYRIWANVEASFASKWYGRLMNALPPKDCPEWSELQHTLTFEIGGKEITLPETNPPAGAAETIAEIMREYIVKEEEMTIADTLLCFALLCVKPYYGVFSDDGEQKAAELIEFIKKAPAVIIYPTINFFFATWKRQKQSGTKSYPAVIKILKSARA